MTITIKANRNLSEEERNTLYEFVKNMSSTFEIEVILQSKCNVTTIEPHTQKDEYSEIHT